LVYELKARQLDLERQNEELRRQTAMDLCESEALYRLIVERYSARLERF